MTSFCICGLLLVMAGAYRCSHKFETHRKTFSVIFALVAFEISAITGFEEFNAPDSVTSVADYNPGGFTLTVSAAEWQRALNIKRRELADAR